MILPFLIRHLTYIWPIFHCRGRLAMNWSPLNLFWAIRTISTYTVERYCMFCISLYNLRCVSWKNTGVPSQRQNIPGLSPRIWPFLLLCRLIFLLIFFGQGQKLEVTKPFVREPRELRSHDPFKRTQWLLDMVLRKVLDALLKVINPWNSEEPKSGEIKTNEIK